MRENCPPTEVPYVFNILDALCPDSPPQTLPIEPTSTSSSLSQTEQTTPGAQTGNPTDTSSGTSSHHIPVGAIVGGVLGGVLLACLVAYIFFVRRRRRRHALSFISTEKSDAEEIQSRFEIDASSSARHAANPISPTLAAHDRPSVAVGSSTLAASGFYMDAKPLPVLTATQASTSMSEPAKVPRNEQHPSASPAASVPVAQGRSVPTSGSAEIPPTNAIEHTSPARLPPANPPAPPVRMPLALNDLTPSQREIIGSLLSHGVASNAIADVVARMVSENRDTGGDTAPPPTYDSHDGRRS